MPRTGRVFDISRGCVEDGPGLRTVVFLKGCRLGCPWCHNLEGVAFEPEISWDRDRCIGCGRCEAACPREWPSRAAWRAGCERRARCVAACPARARRLVGRDYEPGALVAEVLDEAGFLRGTGGGVTFSGGEPLMQPAFLSDIVSACRASAIHVAVDTCGHADTGALLDIARDADLFLFDLKMMDEERHRAFTGASNVRILQNLERLAAVHGNILVRFPLIPGVNDDDDNVRAMGAFLASLRLTRVDVLPYHRAGIAKYERLQRPYQLADTQPPSTERVEHVVRMLESCGLIVRPGGSS